MAENRDNLSLFSTDTLNTLRCKSADEVSRQAESSGFSLSDAMRICDALIKDQAKPWVEGNIKSQRWAALLLALILFFPLVELFRGLARLDAAIRIKKQLERYPKVDA